MKSRNMLAIGVTVGALVAIAADYTVPKVWKRNGAEYARKSVCIYDPLNTNTPIAIHVTVRRVDGSDENQHWTPELVSSLPAVKDGVTNLFKIRMTTMFGIPHIVNAFNWGLVDGREWSMKPTNDVVETP